MTKAVRLEVDGPGVRDDTTAAWYWSGALAPGDARKVVVGYETAGISGVRYAVEAARQTPIRDQRVAVRVNGVTRIISDSKGGGGRPGTRDGPTTHTVVWERKRFLPPDDFRVDVPEGQSLQVALTKLIQMGPIVTGLFLITIVSLIRARRVLLPTTVQTIAVAYFFYFPFVLYLSVRLDFGVAIALAALIPGSLLINHLRILVGPALGWVGAPLVLVIFQVFPTIAAFGAWNRGLVLSSCGVVTLAVVLDLQNRALRAASRAPATGGAATAGAGGIALLAILSTLGTAPVCRAAADPPTTVSVTLPASLAPPAPAAPGAPEPLLASFGVARYEARAHERYVEVHATLPVEVLRAGPAGRALFPGDVPILGRALPAGLYLAEVDRDLGLGARSAVSGTIMVTYRAPLTHAGERVEAEVPVFLGRSGMVTFDGPAARLDVTNGTLWETHGDDALHAEIGVTGREPLTLGWSTAPSGDETTDGDADSDAGPNAGLVYGIHVQASDQLTVIHSDGTCTHFAAFELPPDHPDVFEVTLPDGGEVLSTVVDGREITRPERDGARRRIPLGPHARRGEPRLVSLRLALPAIQLGFEGSFELVLPDVDTTVGATRWVVALPASFRTRVLSSGMEEQGGAALLDGFGDYGRALTGRTMIVLGKTLQPPARVRATVRYFERVPGVNNDLEASFAGLTGSAATPASGAVFQAPFFTKPDRGRASP